MDKIPWFNCGWRGRSQPFGKGRRLLALLPAGKELAVTEGKKRPIGNRRLIVVGAVPLPGLLQHGGDLVGGDGAAEEIALAELTAPFA